MFASCVTVLLSFHRLAAVALAAVVLYVNQDGPPLPQVAAALVTAAAVLDLPWMADGVPVPPTIPALVHMFAWAVLTAVVLVSFDLRSALGKAQLALAVSSVAPLFVPPGTPPCRRPPVV